MFKPYIKKEKNNINFVKADFTGLTIKNNKLYCFKGINFSEQERGVRFKEPLEVDYLLPLLKQSLEISIKKEAGITVKYFFDEKKETKAKLNEQKEIVENNVKLPDTPESNIFRKILKVKEEENERILFNKLRQFMLSTGKMNYIDYGVSRLCRNKILTEKTLRKYEKKHNKRIPRPLTFISSPNNVKKNIRRIEKKGYSAAVLKIPEGSRGFGVVPTYLDENNNLVIDKIFRYRHGKIIQTDKLNYELIKNNFLEKNKRIIVQGVPENLKLWKGCPSNMRICVHPIIKGNTVEKVELIHHQVILKLLRDISPWYGGKRKILSNKKVNAILKTTLELCHKVDKKPALILPGTYRKTLKKAMDISLEIIQAIFEADSDGIDKNLNAEYLGFDFLIVENDNEIEPSFIEINSSPGILSLTKYKKEHTRYRKKVVYNIIRKVKQIPD